MKWFLLPAHVAACVAWVYCINWEVRENYRLIQADGSRDSLHQSFHRTRTLIRLLAGLLLSFAASLPLWHNGRAMALSVLALLLLFGGIFVYLFNPQLNLARGKAEDYVSQAPNASLLDRFMVHVSKECAVKHGKPIEAYLPHAFRVVLNVCLDGALLIYATLTIWAMW